MRLLTFAVVGLLTATLSGQTPAQLPERKPDPTAAISGVVVDGTSGEPIENATVMIAGSGASGLMQQRQFTDAKGRFVFVNLPTALDYTFTANAPGYFSGSFSRESGPSDQRLSIPVKADEWVKDVRLTVWKPGSISGRVIDEHGDPMVGLFVRALGRVPIAGREQLVGGAIAVTDDRGMYRIAGLNAGRYVVEVPSVQTPPSTNVSAAASPSSYGGVNGAYPWSPPPAADGRSRGYPITFFPSARGVGEATAIEVNLAEERAAVDIVMTPVPLFKVAGTLQGPAEGLTMRLVPVGLEALGNGGEAAYAQISSDGAFAFVGVPAGSYTLDVRRRTPEFTMAAASQGRRLPSPSPPNPSGPYSSSTYSHDLTTAPPLISLSESQFTIGQPKNPSIAYARQDIAVANRDVLDLLLNLRNPATMDGTIEFDAAPGAPDARPKFTSIAFALEPANGQPDLGIPTGGVTQGTVFHIDGLRGGEYLLRTRGLTGWVVKSVTWNGDDYTYRPFDAAATSAFNGVVITLTNRAAAITGTVREKSAAVILYPADPARWSMLGFTPPQVRAVATGLDGSFRIDGLPAGDYWVVAVDASQRSAWLEPGFFARMMPFASRVTVDWGSTGSATLAVAAVRR